MNSILLSAALWFVFCLQFAPVDGSFSVLSTQYSPTRGYSSVFSTSALSWQEAADFCTHNASLLLAGSPTNTAGFELASITTEDDQRAVERLSVGALSWIGLKRERNGNEYRWNGKGKVAFYLVPLNASSKRCAPGFSCFFYSLEPQGREDEDCVVMRPDGFWVDFFCTHPLITKWDVNQIKHVVCSWELPPPVRLSTAVSPYGRRSFAMFRAVRSWEGAAAECNRVMFQDEGSGSPTNVVTGVSQAGGQLAVVKSVVDTWFLQKLLSSTGIDKAWFGLHRSSPLSSDLTFFDEINNVSDIIHQNVLDCLPWKYCNFAFNEPRRSLVTMTEFERPNCGALKAEGRWEMRPCNQPGTNKTINYVHYFVCSWERSVNHSHNDCGGALSASSGLLPDEKAIPLNNNSDSASSTSFPPPFSSRFLLCENIASETPAQKFCSTTKSTRIAMVGTATGSFFMSCQRTEVVDKAPVCLFPIPNSTYSDNSHIQNREKWTVVLQQIHLQRHGIQFVPVEFNAEGEEPETTGFFNGNESLQNFAMALANVDAILINCSLRGPLRLFARDMLNVNLMLVTTTITSAISWGVSFLSHPAGSMVSCSLEILQHSVIRSHWKSAVHVDGGTLEKVRLSVVDSEVVTQAFAPPSTILGVATLVFSGNTTMKDAFFYILRSKVEGEMVLKGPLLKSSTTSLIIYGVVIRKHADNFTVFVKDSLVSAKVTVAGSLDNREKDSAPCNVYFTSRAFEFQSLPGTIWNQLVVEIVNSFIVASSSEQIAGKMWHLVNSNQLSGMNFATFFSGNTVQTPSFRFFILNSVIAATKISFTSVLEGHTTQQVSSWGIDFRLLTLSTNASITMVNSTVAAIVNMKAGNSWWTGMIHPCNAHPLRLGVVQESAILISGSTAQAICQLDQSSSLDVYNPDTVGRRKPSLYAWSTVLSMSSLSNQSLLVIANSALVAVAVSTLVTEQEPEIVVANADCVYVDGVSSSHVIFENVTINTVIEPKWGRQLMFTNSLARALVFPSLSFTNDSFVVSFFGPQLIIVAGKILSPIGIPSIICDPNVTLKGDVVSTPSIADSVNDINCRHFSDVLHAVVSSLLKPNYSSYDDFCSFSLFRGTTKKDQDTARSQTLTKELTLSLSKLQSRTDNTESRSFLLPIGKEGPSTNPPLRITLSTALKFQNESFLTNCSSNTSCGPEKTLTRLAQSPLSESWTNSVPRVVISTAASAAAVGLSLAQVGTSMATSARVPAVALASKVALCALADEEDKDNDDILVWEHPIRASVDGSLHAGTALVTTLVWIVFPWTVVFGLWLVANRPLCSERVRLACCRVLPHVAAWSAVLFAYFAPSAVSLCVIVWASTAPSDRSLSRALSGGAIGAAALSFLLVLTVYCGFLVPVVILSRRWVQWWPKPESNAVNERQMIESGEALGDTENLNDSTKKTSTSIQPCFEAADLKHTPLPSWPEWTFTDVQLGSSSLVQNAANEEQVEAKGIGGEEEPQMPPSDSPKRCSFVETFGVLFDIARLPFRLWSRGIFAEELLFSCVVAVLGSLREIDCNSRGWLLCIVAAFQALFLGVARPYASRLETVFSTTLAALEGLFGIIGLLLESTPVTDTEKRRRLLLGANIIEGILMSSIIVFAVISAGMAIYKDRIRAFSTSDVEPTSGGDSTDAVLLQPMLDAGDNSQQQQQHFCRSAATRVNPLVHTDS